MKNVKKIGILLVLFMALTCNYCFADEIILPDDTDSPSVVSTKKAVDQPSNTQNSKEEEEETKSNVGNYVLLGIAIAAVAATVAFLAVKKSEETIGKVVEENKEDKGE